jgi:DNA-binding transcriptional LysR family regulator
MFSSMRRPPDQPAVDASGAGVVLDLRRVLYFVAVAETLSYTKAADRLHLSTSGLSQQIKVLERELRVELLVRDTRHVTLTPAGAQMLASGRELLEANRNAVTAARLASGAELSEIRLAIVTGAEASFEPIMRTLQDRHPALRLSISVTKYAAAMQALVDGSVDAAISWSYLLHDDDTPPSGLRWGAVGEDEAVAGMPARLAPPDGAPIPRGAGVKLGAPLVLFDRRYAPAAYDFAIENIFGGDVGTETVLPIAVLVRAQEAMVHKAAEVGGIAPVAKSISRDLGDILEFRSFDPPWLMELSCAWIQRGGASPHLHSLMEIAHAWATQRPGTPTASPDS